LQTTQGIIDVLDVIGVICSGADQPNELHRIVVWIETAAICANECP
jgi:hypothetical protein